MNDVISMTGPWQLEESNPHSDAQPNAQPNAQVELPPPVQGMQIAGLGTAGCKVAQLAERDMLAHGERPSVLHFDYPVPTMPPLPMKRPNGEVIDVPAEPFCRIGDVGDRRDRAKQYPLLARRYAKLLRGTPVFEDRKLALSGEGGGAIGAVSALDLDLNIESILAFIAEHHRWMLGVPATHARASDLERIAQVSLQREQTLNRPWVEVFVFGMTGATGNALSQLLPYLVRLVLKDMGLLNVQLWGIALGPQAFKGLTPFVMHNSRALLHSLDHMARHGQRREYINGLRVDMDLPPFDQLFIIDDPTLATDDKNRVTEAALDGFYRRAARTVRLLLTTNAWDVVSARTINAREREADGDRLRWMNVLNAATAAMDRPMIVDQAIQARQARLLETLAARLA